MVVTAVFLAAALLGAYVLSPSSGSSSANGCSLAVPQPQTDWFTYHYDNKRDAAPPTESPPCNPVLAWTRGLNGTVYAEPLVFNGSVYLATEADNLYALSPSDGHVIWMRNLGTPLPKAQLSCGDIDPVGITGTPAIDPGSGSLYVVTMTQGKGYTLQSLDTSNGKILWSASLSEPGFDYHFEQQRGALTIANGLVYVTFGGFAGDCGQYQGWVLAYPLNGVGSHFSYAVPTAREAGIWSPAGAVVDSSGFVYVVTGNSVSTTTFDYGDSVVKLSPNLTVLDYFAPADWVNLNRNDADISAVGATLLPGNLILQVGKSGEGYLLNGTNLGKVGGQIDSAKVCGGAYGSTAFVNYTVYVPCNDGLFVLDVKPGAHAAFYPSWKISGFFASPPIVAAGAVWFINRSDGILLAANPLNGSVLFSLPLGSVQPFTTPAFGEGLVFATAGSKVFAVSPRS